MKNNPVEKIQTVGQTQLQSDFDNRTNKGLEARVRVRDFERVARPNDTHGQHAGGVNDLDWRVDRITAEGLGTRMLFLPICGRLERRLFQDFAALQDHFVNCHKAFPHHVCCLNSARYMPAAFPMFHQTMEVKSLPKVENWEMPIRISEIHNPKMPLGGCVSIGTGFVHSLCSST